MASNDEIMDFEFFEDFDAKINKELAKETDVEVKKRIRHEMDEETKKVREVQPDVKFGISATEVTSSNNYPTFEERIEADARSVFVGNVAYEATDDELRQHFSGCGVINRVSIVKNRFNGRPKGIAYVEFLSTESAEGAMKLNQSSFKGRDIRVNPKRSNRPGYTATNRGRGRGVNRFRAQQQRERSTWTAPNSHPREPTKKFSKRFAPY